MDKTDVNRGGVTGEINSGELSESDARRITGEINGCHTGTIKEEK